MAPRPKRKNRYRKPSVRPAQVGRQGLNLLLAFLQGAALMGAMSFLFLFAHDFLTQCPFFAAQQITVEGCERLGTGEVIQTAQIVHGSNTLAVNLALARKRLLAHSWIADAQVSREMPHTIAIRIREHRPLAVVNLGKQFLLNEQGEIFKERQPSDPGDLPLVSGMEFGDFSPGTRSPSPAFSAVMEVLGLGRNPTGIVPNATISAIAVDRELGLTLHAGDQDRRIKLGYADYPAKFQKLKTVMGFMENRPELAGAQSIDLLNINRVVIHPDREAPPSPGRKEA